MKLFSESSPIRWSCNEQGIALYFHSKRDFDRASNGKGSDQLKKIFRQYQALLETGEAVVEQVAGGAFIGADDAVRLDDETRELFGLPSIWPGYFLLDTHSVPNLDLFDAVLRLIDVEGRDVSRWDLKGPILEVNQNHFLPSRTQYACLRAYQDWKSTPSKRESTHLRFIHVLTEAASCGCKVDVTRVGRFRPAVATECVVDAADQPDGSLLLTPVPLFDRLPEMVGVPPGIVEGKQPTDIYSAYRKAIECRLGQLENGGDEAIFRVGAVIVLLDKPQTEQARGIIRNRLVPAGQRSAFQRDPAQWMAEHVFNHGEVEFLPRVIGIGEWTGGYLGAAGELGDKIDWFDKQPEAEKADNDSTETGNEDSSSGGDPHFDHDSEEPTGPLVPIIEANDEELRWGLHGERTEDPDTVRIQPEFEGYPRKPFPHQEEAVLWLAGHSERCGRPAKWEEGARFWGAGALLADDMGLGKTLSTLIFLSMWYRTWQRKVGASAPACLIVCPLSLIENWREEIEAAFSAELNPFSRVVRAIPDGDLRHYFATPDGKDLVKAKADRPEQAVEQYGLKFGDGSEASLDRPGTVVLTTYATLRDYRFSFAGCQWSAVIFDEAQNIKNPNALQTIAAKALKGFFRVALSGTPVENHLGDLWSLMDAVEPGALGSFRDFRSKWIHPIRSDPSQLQVIGEALRKQLDRLILRRTKEESLKGLPSKHIIPVRVKMTEGQAQLYDEILESVNSSGDDEATAARVNRWLACMWELRRISLHPALMGDAAGEPALNSKSSREFLCQSAKLEWLLSQLDSIQGTGDKVLIFSVQRKLQGLLAAHLSEIYSIKIPIINGDTNAVSARASKKPNETRLGLINEFSKADGFGICILSPIAAGAGLNITAANHVIHLERHWNPAKEDQATDRAYRIGQTKDVHVYLPMLEHPTRDITTFDTGLDQLISRKKNLAGSLGLIPVQSVSRDEVFEAVLKGVTFKSSSIPVFLDLEKACKLSWEHFEALVAVVFDRESDQVILTSRGRDHGADVVVMGYGGQTNILIQAKTTKSGSLDSEQAIREVEGSLRFFESRLGVKFHQKSIHTNASHFSRRTRKSAELYDVSLHGRDWIKSVLAKHQIRIGEVVERNAQRKSL
jgi:hypothetical protein